LLALVGLVGDSWIRGNQGLHQFPKGIRNFPGLLSGHIFLLLRLSFVFVKRLDEKGKIANLLFADRLLVIQQNAILNFFFESTKVENSEKGWQYLSLLILVFLSVPIASIVFISLGQSGDLWVHLFDTVLPKYIMTTLWLMIGSVIGATIIGVSTAWVTSVYDFKGKTLLRTLLTLPLAMPAYLMAYVWTDLLEYAGPFQNSLRSFFLWKSSQDY
jgi:ABC-type sugar transport system permease subunit